MELHLLGKPDPSPCKTPIELHDAILKSAPHPGSCIDQTNIPEKVPNPSERLLTDGTPSLSAEELLAILFGGDADRSMTMATEIMASVERLAALRKVSYHDLIRTEGMSRRGAIVILAAVELSRRLSVAGVPERPTISSPKDVETLLSPKMRDLDREHFVVLLLDTKNRVVNTETVSIGTLSSSLVHPREVFKGAVKASAASVILVHNHPSGHLEPSREDREVTKRLVEAGEILGIEVLDHVILGNGYLSLKERVLL